MYTAKTRINILTNRGSKVIIITSGQGSYVTHSSKSRVYFWCLQVYQPSTGEYIYYDKWYGRSITEDTALQGEHNIIQLCILYSRKNFLRVKNFCELKIQHFAKKTFVDCPLRVPADPRLRTKFAEKPSRNAAMSRNSLKFPALRYTVESLNNVGMDRYREVVYYRLVHWKVSEYPHLFVHAYCSIHIQWNL